jgi:cell wall assembly regulator SMI1
LLHTQGDLQQAQQQRPEQLQQQHKQALQQHDGQEQRSPFSAPAFAHPQFTVSGNPVSIVACSETL